MPTLPLFKLKIDDIDSPGMDAIALVDYPAHGKGFHAFNKMKPKKVERQQFFDDEQRIVTGVAIATNLPIYRRDADGFEYNIVFTKDDTRMIAIALAENGYINNVNEMHDTNKDVQEMVLFGSYFIEDDKRNIPDVFADQNLQPGTWITSYKVNNDEVWEKLKSGEYYGFSIEGWFQHVELKTKLRMKGKSKVQIKGKFATIQAISKWDIDVFQDDITIGTELTYAWLDENGKLMDGGRLSDGEYHWEDHKIQVDSNGIVVMIDGQTEGTELKAKKPKLKNKKMNKEKKSLFERVFGKKKAIEKAKFDSENKDKYATAVTVDGVNVFWEGELEEGVTSLFVEVEGEDPILAEAGDHSIEVDGEITVLTVDESGIITNIETTEGEGDPEDDDMAETMKEIRKENKAALAKIEKDLEKKFNKQLEVVVTELETVKTEFSDYKKEVEDLFDGKKPKSKQGAQAPGWKKEKK